MEWSGKTSTEMVHHYLNSHASVCPPTLPSHGTLPPLPQCTQRPWTRPKDHLRERGDPLCYVSAREWNNTESSSANNSQWRSFSTCCLTKGKIRTDDILSLLCLWEFGAALCSHTWSSLCCGALLAVRCRGLTPLVALFRVVWDTSSHC